jgi:hypothetical protein
MPPLLFCVNTYRDHLLAAECIAALKFWYPEAGIVSISDGTGYPGYDLFCKSVGVEHIFGTRLKLPSSAGRWTERFLKILLSSDHDLVVKVDPDTHINREADLPDAPVFSAFRYNYHGERVLAGPAIGFRRDAAQAIVDSNLLLDPVYETKFFYPRFWPPFLKPGEDQSSEMISCQDEITTSVVERLGIEPKEWAAVSLTDPAAPFYHRP